MIYKKFINRSISDQIIRDINTFVATKSTTQPNMGFTREWVLSPTFNNTNIVQENYGWILNTLLPKFKELGLIDWDADYIVQF